VPNTPTGRPPGRSDGRRPPKGRAPLPAAPKYDKVLADLPTARKALAVLRDAGRSDLAVVVGRTIDFAQEAAERGVNKRRTDSQIVQGKTLRVVEAFRTHVHEQARLDEGGKALWETVEDGFRDFLAGRWTPDKPQRAPRGSNLEKKGLSVRVDGDLWDAVNTKGKDPAEVAARGYSLTAEQIGIATLYRRFGAPSTTA